MTMGESAQQIGNRGRYAEADIGLPTSPILLTSEDQESTSCAADLGRPTAWPATLCLDEPEWVDGRVGPVESDRR